MNLASIVLGSTLVVTALLVGHGNGEAATRANAPAPVCSGKKLKEILAPATQKKRVVRINCSVTLPAGATITKRVEFLGPESSNVILNCNGSKIKRTKVASSGFSFAIAVKSRKRNGVWLPPENVTIRNCAITGPIRIMGMGVNGEADAVRQSSYRRDHVSRVQAAAPRNVVFEKVSIRGTGIIPLYVSPGVTGVVLRNSRLFGVSKSVAIYLDAESSHNVIEGNRIEVATRREQIAVDGAAYTQIVGNRFANLSNGGIYLYRNCGEGGTIRHQAPQYNRIVSNHFYYKKFKGRKFSAKGFALNLSFRVPAIWLGQRDGKRQYCHHDRGYAFGSSVSDKSYADNNYVANNQIVKLKPSWMIINQGKNNVVQGNRRVRR